jgi:hypothetical protein
MKTYTCLYEDSTDSFIAKEFWGVSLTTFSLFNFTKSHFQLQYPFIGTYFKAIGLYMRSQELTTLWLDLRLDILVIGFD